MILRPNRLRVAVACCVWLASLASRAAYAQVTPAAGFTPPDDTPSIKIGVTFYGDYTYTQNPKSTDADGNIINPSAFNVSRSYINVTGNVNHIDRVPHHARRGPGDGPVQRRDGGDRRQRQPGVPDQVRLRPVQSRRLDDRRDPGPASASSRRRCSTTRKASTATGSRARRSPSARASTTRRMAAPRFTSTFPRTTATCTSASTTAKATPKRIPTIRRRLRSAGRFVRSRPTRRFCAASA